MTGDSVPLPAGPARYGGDPFTDLERAHTTRSPIGPSRRTPADLAALESRYAGRHRPARTTPRPAVTKREKKKTMLTQPQQAPKVLDLYDLVGRAMAHPRKRTHDRANQLIALAARVRADVEAWEANPTEPGHRNTCPKGVYPCDTCGRVFDTPQGKSMHRRRAHEGFNPSARRAVVAS